MPASAPPRAALPARPTAATIAVVPRDGAVLLVRRANPPDAGRWGFPGGKIETGEALLDAAIRELREETQVEAEAVEVLTAVDAFDHDETGALRQHFILIAVLCRWRAGAPVAGDDALEARWFPVETLEREDLALSIGAADLARQALVCAAGRTADPMDRRES
ncbi:Bifunctional NMN adenylyltransferase/Nudix hydrolase [bacterium YEK0313]|nr:Bifunctional NMN adenylyltransferase/Nudix hydrolase [bacterium YEK0313]